MYNIGLCQNRHTISQPLWLVLSTVLIFFIISLPTIVCAQSLPPSLQQPTNSKSPTELFIPILVAIITGLSAVIVAYLSGLFIKRADFDKLFESTLMGSLTRGDFLNIIHQMGGFLKKEELEKSIKNFGYLKAEKLEESVKYLIMTKTELARIILNSLIVSFLEEKSIDQLKSLVESKPSKTMTMAPKERSNFIIDTFQQLTKFSEVKKD